MGDIMRTLLILILLFSSSAFAQSYQIYDYNYNQAPSNQRGTSRTISDHNNFTRNQLNQQLMLDEYATDRQIRGYSGSDRNGSVNRYNDMR